MGVRVEVEDGEQIGQALRRLKQLVYRAGVQYCLRDQVWRQTEPGEFRRWYVVKAKYAAQRAAFQRRQRGIE
jgi:ribosomal protein S21